MIDDTEHEDIIESDVDDDEQKEEIKQYIFHVEPDEVKMRLDLFIQKRLPELSRTRIVELIESYLVKVNGRVEKPSYKMKLSSSVVVRVPPPVPAEIKPQPYPLKIVYEDEDIIVINKDRGITVHPTAGNYTDTLVNYVLYHCKDLSGIAGELRPGVVHRLDKETSGLIVMAKNDLAHQDLAKQFKYRTVEKYYNAIVKSPLPFPEGYIRKSIIRDPVKRQRMFATEDLKLGKSALTWYEVVENYKRGSFVRIKLYTGRTHQIRVHFASIGHPLVGDSIYLNKMKKIDMFGLALVAKELKIVHPRTKKELYFTVPLPDHFDKIIRMMRENVMDDEEGPDVF